MTRTFVSTGPVRRPAATETMARRTSRSSPAAVFASAALFVSPVAFLVGTRHEVERGLSRDADPPAARLAYDALDPPLGLEPGERAAPAPRVATHAR